VRRGEVRWSEVRPPGLGAMSACVLCLCMRASVCLSVKGRARSAAQRYTYRTRPAATHHRGGCQSRPLFPTTSRPFCLPKPHHGRLVQAGLCRRLHYLCRRHRLVARPLLLACPRREAVGPRRYRLMSRFCASLLHPSTAPPCADLMSPGCEHRPSGRLAAVSEPRLWQVSLHRK
jgi:hypothetical protein